MNPHLGAPGHRATNTGARRAMLAAAVTMVVLAVRQLVDLVLRSTVPMWSTGATMLVETLALAGVYAAAAWYFVVVPARRRSASPDSVSHLHPVAAGSGTGPSPVRVAANRPRHLTLVR